jgi:hypothetical protein
MLFFGYFSCVIVAFTVVAMWLISSFNYSSLPKHPHPRPPSSRRSRLSKSRRCIYRPHRKKDQPQRRRTFLPPSSTINAGW